MKRPALASPSLPISWTHDEYVEGVNEHIEINPVISDNMRMRDTIEYIMKEIFIIIKFMVKEELNF